MPGKSVRMGSLFKKYFNILLSVMFCGVMMLKYLYCYSEPFLSMIYSTVDEFKKKSGASIVKCLLHKLEDINSDPQHSYKKLCVRAFTCDLNPGK